MKKYWCIVLCFLLILVLNAPAVAASNEQVVLSDLSQEECIIFLKEQGVDIPQIFEDETTWGFFAHSIIEQVEENPNIEFPYGSVMMSEFAYQIKDAVIRYYGVDDIAIYADIESPNNIMVDNILYGEWQTEYPEYNCYAYAIGKKEWLEPGVSIWLDLGNNKDEYAYNCYANMSTITYWIESDLEYFGNTVNSITTTIPSIEVGGHTHLICVRKDADGVPWYYDEDGDLKYFHDYHFMKMGEDGYWYHKPGKTNPLKYLYTPSNEKSWVSEGYNGANGIFFRYESVTYDSEIYFIEYTTPHTYAYESCGNGQHILTCTICGETTGSANDHNLGIGDYTGNHYHEGSVHSYEYRSTCRDCGECVYYWEGMLCMGPPCTVPDTGLLEAEGEEVAQ